MTRIVFGLLILILVGCGAPTSEYTETPPDGTEMTSENLELEPVDTESSGGDAATGGEPGAVEICQLLIDGACKDGSGGTTSTGGASSTGGSISTGGVVSTGGNGTGGAAPGIYDCSSFVQCADDHWKPFSALVGYCHAGGSRCVANDQGVGLSVFQCTPVDGACEWESLGSCGATAPKPLDPYTPQEECECYDEPRQCSWIDQPQVGLPANCYWTPNGAPTVDVELCY